MFHLYGVNHLQNEIAAIESLVVKKQFKSRLQCVRRMQDVFWKTGKRLKLAGVQVRDNEGQIAIVSSPPAVQQALSSRWSLIYARNIVTCMLPKQY